jgi:hypothetical protein
MWEGSTTPHVQARGVRKKATHPSFSTQASPSSLTPGKSPQRRQQADGSAWYPIESQP